MEIHIIEAKPHIVQSIINEDRLFHVIDNLPHCVQKGDRVRIKGGGKEAYCIVTATTNEHQHINHMVIGLRIVRKKTDSETFSGCNVDEVSRQEMKLEPWQKDGRFDNKKSWERVMEIDESISKELPLKGKILTSDKKISDWEEEKTAILARQKVNK